MLHATCAFVEVEGIGQVHPELPVDIVPVFPSRTTHRFWSAYTSTWVSFVREQIPLMPAYVYTDYKAQGRSLDTVIVDLASTTKPQGRYVMLSRVKSLEGLAVLRPFSSECFSRPLQKYIRDELKRVSVLAEETSWEFREQHDNEVEFEDDLGVASESVEDHDMDVDSEEDVEMDVDAEEDHMSVDGEGGGTSTELTDDEHDIESDMESEEYSDYEEEYMMADAELEFETEY